MTPGVWQIGPDACFGDDGSIRLVEGLSIVFHPSLRRERTPHDSCATLSLTGSGPGEAQILRHGTTSICRVDHPDELPPAMEKLIGAWIQAFTQTAAVLHAAWLIDRGRSILLPAERGSGKSTFSLLRALRGAEYGGDDMVIVDPDRGTIQAVPKSITLKQGSFAFLPFPAPEWRDPVRGPIRYWRPDRVVTAAHPLSEIRALVLPRFMPAASPSIRPLPSGLSALALVQQLFGGLDRGHSHLDVVRKLTAVPAFALTYANPESMHELTDELLGQL